MPCFLPLLPVPGRFRVPSILTPAGRRLAATLARQLLTTILSCVWFGLALTAYPAQAEEKAPEKAPENAADKSQEYPAGISLPWRLIGIDPAISGPVRSALTTTAALLANSWLSAPQSLSAYVGKQHVITRNNHLRSDHFLVGKPQTAAATPLAVEPTWCSVMDRYVFFVTVADAKRNTLLGSAHTTVARSTFTTQQAALAFLSAQLPQLTRAALAAAARQPQTASDALHVALDLAANATRSDEGSSLCLTLLLEEQLAPQFTVVRQLGGEPLALTRLLLNQAPELRRPTRALVLKWQHEPENTFNRQLPLTMQLTATMAETVFGHHLAGALSNSWTFSLAADATIHTAGSEALLKLLDDEQKTLQLKDWPQVAAINRAWVYLDRGRAWGLKMNDRVIADVDGQPVKGHVVRFFGPEAKLKSPRGFPIEEGAIVYIRLGQHLTRKGMTFKMDPRTFPAPVPR